MRIGSFISLLTGCAQLTPYQDAIAKLPKEHFLTLRGRKIFVQERGSGPPLLLLHGFAASSYSFSGRGLGLLRIRLHGTP